MAKKKLSGLEKFLKTGTESYADKMYHMYHQFKRDSGSYGSVQLYVEMLKKFYENPYFGPHFPKLDQIMKEFRSNPIPEKFMRSAHDILTIPETLELFIEKSMERSIKKSGIEKNTFWLKDIRNVPSGDEKVIEKILKLGEGGMAVVKYGFMRNAGVVVLKMAKDQKGVQLLENEERFQSMFAHRNILPSFGFDDNRNIILPLFPGKDLRWYMNKHIQIHFDDEVERIAAKEGLSKPEIIKKYTLTFKDVYNLIVQQSDVIETIGNKGLIFRDITPANYFCIPTKTGMFSALADFGIAMESKTKDYSFAGTMGYIPFEAFLFNKDSHSMVPKISDAFPFGNVLYRMLSGHLHLHSSSQGKSIINQKDGDPIKGLFEYFNDDYKSADGKLDLLEANPLLEHIIGSDRANEFSKILNMILRKYPKDRSTISEFKKASKEFFFRNPDILEKPIYFDIDYLRQIAPFVLERHDYSKRNILGGNGTLEQANMEQYKLQLSDLSKSSGIPEEMLDIVLEDLSGRLNIVIPNDKWKSIVYRVKKTLDKAEKADHEPDLVWIVDENQKLDFVDKGNGGMKDKFPYTSMGKHDDIEKRVLKIHYNEQCKHSGDIETFDEFRARTGEKYFEIIRRNSYSDVGTFYDEKGLLDFWKVEIDNLKNEDTADKDETPRDKEYKLGDIGKFLLRNPVFKKARKDNVPYAESYLRQTKARQAKNLSPLPETYEEHADRIMEERKDFQQYDKKAKLFITFDKQGMAKVEKHYYGHRKIIIKDKKDLLDYLGSKTK